MNVWHIISFVSLLATHFIFIESTPCRDDNVDLGGQVTSKSGVVELQAFNQSITIKLKAIAECTLTIKGYKGMQMDMDVKRYTLGTEDKCKSSYLKAGPKVDEYKLEVCSDSDKIRSIRSTDASLVLALKTSDASKDVLLNFASVQGKECGDPEIVLKDVNQKIEFPMNNVPFTKTSECYITVRGIEGRGFKMNVTNIKLSDGDCANDYILASTTPITEKTTGKMCKPDDVKNPMSVPEGVLYVKILTSAPNSASVSLNFLTEYPECGPNEVEIPEEDKEVTLPPSGQKFQTNTMCNIAFIGKNRTNFKMTIPTINLADGDCKNDYVSASTMMTRLPNDTYRKCGTSPVNDPFLSADGAMYVQIKTTKVNDNTKVQFKFTPVSGAYKTGHYTFLTIIIVKVLTFKLF